MLHRTNKRRNHLAGCGRKLSLEWLEARCVPAVLLTGGLLDVVADNADNTIDLDFNPGTGRIEVLIDGSNQDPANPTGYLLADVTSIRIRGLKGDDTITVDAAIDRPADIGGDAGHDTITSGSGDDTIDGGAGHDVIDSGAGNDSIVGGAGNDSLTGGNDDDTLSGGAGKDTLAGGDDDDLLLGGPSGDQLSGGADDDLLSGEAGTDVLNGDNGDDILQTSKGRDTLTGGSGTDLFGRATKTGVRADFTPGTDVDAGQAVVPGNYDDPGLEGNRTDQSGGAPDITDRHHQDGTIDYSLYSNPPTYGPHHGFDPTGIDSNPGITPRRTGIYTTEQPDEDLVHNLEHGHVWLSYDPTLLAAADVVKLQFLLATFGPGQGIILTPRAANDDALALASWGRLETLAGFDLDTICDFILANRGHAPEGFITP